VQGAEPAERAGEAATWGRCPFATKVELSACESAHAMTSATGQSGGVSWPLPAWLRRPWGFWFPPCFELLVWATLPRPFSRCGRWNCCRSAAQLRTHAHLHTCSAAFSVTPGGAEARCPLPITRKEVVLHTHHTDEHVVWASATGRVASRLSSAIYD
jgi:hypothetical protein